MEQRTGPFSGSRYAFRGLSDAHYHLETTLIRLGGNYADLERHLLRNFKKYAHRNVVKGDSIWHWLSVAQHYGLPTRLLDWTYSPFIAMHFARPTSKSLTWTEPFGRQLYQDTPVASDKLRYKLEQEGANVFTVEMLSESVKSLEELAKLTSDHFTLFFEPPSIDDRIINQFAFCSVMSDSTKAWMNGWKITRSSG
jgi:hypothetical protein